MSKDADLSFIDSTGSDDFDLGGAKGIKLIAGMFLEKVQAKARDRKPPVINTGAMISDDNFKFEVSTDGDLTELELFLIYYADFVNRGVKGVKSSRNAPNSPYQYKNLGMPESGRKSILRAVTEGKIKISDKTKTKYGKIGLEGKAQETPNIAEINEREASRIAYLIKAFGIKTTNFIDDAWDEWKKEITPMLKDTATRLLIGSLIKATK